MNVQNRAIVNIAESSVGCIISVERVQGLFPRSDLMFKHSATNANKSPEPPLTHPGAPPDSERAKQPPLPEPPYRPYTKKPAEPEHPYAPYEGM